MPKSKYQFDDPKAALEEAESRVHQAQLTRASELDLSRLGLIELPNIVRSLTQIDTLCLSDNQLVSLPEWLGQLTHLRVLHLSKNELRSLPESLGRLIQLRKLHLQSNRLTMLPEALRNLTRLEELRLEDNRELLLPPELLSTANRVVNPASILGFYFQSSARSRPLNEAKLILVGRPGAGKTSLSRGLTGGTFGISEAATAGIEIRTCALTVPSGDSVRLHVWEFGGQEILHSTHQFFFTERTLYLLVLSGRQSNPSDDAEYWLQLIRNFGGDSKIIIALNKSQEHPFEVNRRYLLEKYPSIVDFVKTDCATGIGLSELKNLILHQVDAIEDRKINFPASWFAIKEHLAAMAEQNKNYLSHDAYKEICRKFGESNAEAQQKLALCLHDLGVVLNFRNDSRLKATHVLSPCWVTEGVYHILRAATIRSRQGVLDSKDLTEALDGGRYPKEKHEFLVALMEKFGLCFQLPRHSGKSKQWLIPELLDENQPDLQTLLEQPGLGFRFQYEMLPGGLLPRFIVQTHHFSKNNPRWRWRAGVVLDWHECHAVVRADHIERRVDIHVVGPENGRRVLLDIIRKNFKDLHSSTWKALKVEERIPIPGDVGATIGYQHLLALEQDGQTMFRPEGSNGRINISELLKGLTLPPRQLTLKLVKLEITNIRCFKQISISFTESEFNQPRQWTMLIGENACGKTTILRCIAIGLCNESDGTALIRKLKGHFIRKGCEEGKITLTLEEDGATKRKHVIATVIQRTPDAEGEVLRKQIKSKGEFPWKSIFVCGYGTHRSGVADASYEGYLPLPALSSLFDASTPMQNPEVVLLKAGSFKEHLSEALKRILMLEKHDLILPTTPKSGLEVEGPWGRFPLPTLSDGYKSTTQWVMDFFGWAIYAGRTPRTAGGILLIDELEQHLHPLWQRHVVQRISEQLPNTQIIATTHTPLVAAAIGDIKGAAIVSTNPTNDRTIMDVSLCDARELRGKRADQLLAQVFGLPSTRSVHSQGDLARYTELQSKKRTDTEEKEFHKLQKRLEAGLQFGETSYEQEVERAVRNVLDARLKSSVNPALSFEIKRQLRKLFGTDND